MYNVGIQPYYHKGYKMRLVITLSNNNNRKTREVTTNRVTKDGMDHTWKEISLLAKAAGMSPGENVKGWRTIQAL